MDTAGILALWDASDQYHRSALKLQQTLLRHRRRIVTSDYVVDEAITLLLKRHSHEAATDFLETVERAALFTVEWVESERFAAASRFFRAHRDETWSFTDCVSFVLMRELKIQEAFTTDHHFTQAGFVALLK